MISTAPYSRAWSVLLAPSSARLEQMTTGMGCCAMILRKNVSPSMRGISISSVITSGTCSLIRSAATNGSLAVAMTSIIGSVERTWLRVCRTSAESSTIRTRIFSLVISGPSGFFSARVRSSVTPAGIVATWQADARTLRPFRYGNEWCGRDYPPRSDAATRKPSLFQDLQCGPAIQGANGWFGNSGTRPPGAHPRRRKA